MNDNSIDWHVKNGTIEWKNHDGFIFVKIEHGRRYLMIQGSDVPIAEQVSNVGKAIPAERWVLQKIKHRIKTSELYVGKLKEQLLEAEQEHQKWLNLQDKLM